MSTSLAGLEIQSWMYSRTREEIYMQRALKGIPEDRVSLSYHLTFRAADRTLTDAEVNTGMEQIVAALAAAHGATQR